jgi:hypothetical protein
VSILSPEQVKGSRHLFGQAGVEVRPVDAWPGAEPVRALAESGEPVAVVPAARPAYDDRDARPAYGGRNARPSADGNGPHRHRRARRPRGRAA